LSYEPPDLGIGRPTSYATGVTAKTRLSATVDTDVLEAVQAAVAAGEAEHGDITDEQTEAAYRRAKARAVVVRGGHVVDDKGSGAAGC
jgi:hypothetical protein